MTTVTFDTLKFAGVLPEHAEAEAEALADIFDANLQELITKEDVRRLEERLSDRFDAKLTQLEQRMTIKLGTLMVIAVTGVATLVKLL